MRFRIRFRLFLQGEVMQLSFGQPGGGFGHEIERLGHLIQLAAKIPAARRLVQEVLDPRRPAWRRAFALAAIIHALMQALEIRKNLGERIEAG